MYNIAQALSVRCALTLAWDEGLNNIILASGCPLLLDIINSPYRVDLWLVSSWRILKPLPL
jgi:hypothetical protein